MAGLISDRATDEVVDALTRYRRGLGISDSPSMHLDDPQTPDVVRSRSNQVCLFYSNIFLCLFMVFFFFASSQQDTMDYTPLRTLDIRYELDSPTVSFAHFCLHQIFVHYVKRSFS